MKKILLLIFFALTVQFSQAQIPGYRGQRFMASYNFNLGFSFIPAWSTQLGAFPRHGLNVDYVIGRRTMIGIGYEYLHAKLDSKASPSYLVESDDYGFNQHSMDFSNHNFGVNLTFFSKEGGTVAPLGGYVKLKLYYCTYNVNQRVDIVTYPTGDFGYINQTYNKQSVYNNIGFGLGYGSIRIIANHVTLDFGGELNVTAKQLSHTYDSVQDVGNDSYAAYTVTPGDWDRRLNGFLWSNFTGTFKLGIGGLLF